MIYPEKRDYDYGNYSLFTKCSSSNKRKVCRRKQTTTTEGVVDPDGSSTTIDPNVWEPESTTRDPNVWEPESTTRDPNVWVPESSTTTDITDGK